MEIGGPEKAKWGEGGSVYKWGGGLPYYIQVFLKIPHDVVKEKNLDVFIFSLLTDMCYKTTDQIKNELTSIVIDLIVLI